MKNISDKKFSYQQLPVSLKLIYTVLQVIKKKTQTQFKLQIGLKLQLLWLFFVVMHLFCVTRKCQSLRSRTSCSTWWTVWRSCVSMASVCTSPVRITPHFWLTSRRRCSSPGVYSSKGTHCCSQLRTTQLYSLCFSLWSMLKSEFCQLASLSVPQLLHALSLPHGADIFWNLINTNFNNQDWKIRFEAGGKY